MKLFVRTIFISLLFLWSCGNTSGTSIKTDTGIGIPKCTKNQDCTSVKVGPCTQGICNLQTHECERKIITDGTACDDENVCTDNDECQQGQCKGSVVDCVQPADSCQSVACDPVKGCQVRDLADGATCDDNDPCTEKDTCHAGHCAGVAKSCGDNLICTSDTCENGQCANKLIAGNCEINGSCYQNGAVNPENVCQACNTSVSTNEWTSLDDGTNVGTGDAVCYKGKVCDPVANCKDKDCGNDDCGGTCGKCGNHYQCEDGKCVLQKYCGDGTCDTNKGENCESCPDDCACDGGEVCFQQQCCAPQCAGSNCGDDGCGGTCWKGQGTECSDGLECTDDQCASGVCRHTLQSGFCVIDNVCYEKDNQNIDDDCQLCDPIKSTTEWSNSKDGILCNNQTGTCRDGRCCVPYCDNRQCGDDRCGGTCWTGGNIECGDGLACTDDSCKEGTCVHQTKSGACVIGGKCYQKNEINDDNPCLVCLPSQQHNGWSVRPDGFDLGNGKVCYNGNICDHAGKCQGKDCGDDNCGGTCGSCESSYICDAQGKCEYQAKCGNGNCDTDENCDSCPQDCACKNGQVCFHRQCCTPQCTGRECGDDNCGGLCGKCEYGQACDAGTGECLGKVLWSYAFGEPVYSQPAIGDNGDLYLGTACAKEKGTDNECADDGPAKLIAVDPSKGDSPVLWSLNWNTAINGSVSIGKNGWLYFGDAKGNVYAYKPNGAQAWQYNMGSGSQIFSSVGLSQLDVFPIDYKGLAVVLDAATGNKKSLKDFGSGGTNKGPTILLNGNLELFGANNGLFRWLSIGQNGYNDANSHSYQIGQKAVSEISMASFGILAYEACMTSMDMGGQFCYAAYNHQPSCYAATGGPYNSITGIVLSMVPDSKDSAYGYFTTSKWSSTSAQNGTYLHRVEIRDGDSTTSEILAHVPGTTWKTPTLLANNQVLFVADDCIYDFKVNTNGPAQQLWKHCFGGIGYPNFINYSIDTSPVPGKLNGQDVVFVIIKYIFGLNSTINNSTIKAIRTLQPIRQAPWPYIYHDTKNTGYFVGNDGGIPW